MERDYQLSILTCQDTDDVDWCTAFHEAGHAAAIHISNRQKQLPQLFFEIHIKKPVSINEQLFAKVVNGNLFQTIPVSVLESLSLVSCSNQNSCQRAFEADVVNLLVGPLAEAKYVSIRDGEVFNLRLINPLTLHNYGGYRDLEKINIYLENFIASKNLREQKLLELVAEAFNFINNQQNWQRINELAKFILITRQEIISYDDVIAVLD